MQGPWAKATTATSVLTWLRRACFGGAQADLVCGRPSSAHVSSCLQKACQAHPTDNVPSTAAAAGTKCHAHQAQRLVCPANHPSQASGPEEHCWVLQLKMMGVVRVPAEMSYTWEISSMPASSLSSLCSSQETCRKTLDIISLALAPLSAIQSCPTARVPRDGGVNARVW